jgi:hypothetical protein
VGFFYPLEIIFLAAPVGLRLVRVGDLQVGCGFAESYGRSHPDSSHEIFNPGDS